MKNKSLDDLWSKAVKTIYLYRCALCGATEGLESHHVVHRRASWVLRWDVENGICLCHKCHNVADMLLIKKKIASHIKYEYLSDMEIKYRFKDDYLLEKGISEKEYRVTKAEELRNIIRRT
jgi:predicted restriction endonuclease